MSTAATSNRPSGSIFAGGNFTQPTRSSSLFSLFFFSLDSKFKQQRLNAWKPVLTPQTVLPLFFAVAVVFIALGAALLSASNTVTEFEVDYSDCNDTLTSNGLCKDLLESDPGCFKEQKMKRVQWLIFFFFLSFCLLFFFLCFSFQQPTPSTMGLPSGALAACLSS